MISVVAKQRLFTVQLADNVVGKVVRRWPFSWRKLLVSYLISDELTLKKTGNRALVIIACCRVWSSRFGSWWQSWSHWQWACLL